MGEEGEKRPDELVKLTFGKADLVKPTLVNTRECGEDEGKDEGQSEQGHHEKLKHPTAEDKQPRPQRSILQGLLRSNSGLTVQTPGGSKCKIQQVLTPGGTSRSTATRVIPHENQDGEDNVDEEEDANDGDQAEDEDLGVEGEVGYIEAEKKRRRLKRMEEEEKKKEESKLKADAFWYSGPTTPSPSPPTVKTNFMSKLDLGKVALMEEEEEELMRQELLEECLDCFRGWVHECLEDVFRVCS